MAFDAFVKIDGIPGESTDAKHRDWIEILSYRHAMNQPVGSAVSRAGGRAAERVDISPFTIIKPLDKASPVLAQHCCSGRHIPKVTLELCQAAGDKHNYMTYVLSDAVVSSVTPTGRTDAEEALPTEEVSFRFGKIEWQYTPVDHTGKAGAQIVSSWNLETNAPA